MSRLKNLQSFRGMRVPARDIQVYRGRWVTISSDKILPGDVISLGKSTEDTISPCDILLLSGTCVVNEAMLTGESTPHQKESVFHGDTSAELQMKHHQLHVVFGGTKIIQQRDNGEHPHLTSPDRGCLAYVLRTGFHTSQGKLMRTILFSTERITANTKEAFFFILFLLVFAVTASGYVLQRGLEDPDRSRYKLMLRCILIITSVVPPELPMELSLAVNNSLIALHALGVFCTEPFRIPYAGKVTVCCFDKTGTLTGENLVMTGVAGLNNSDTSSLTPPNSLPLETQFVLAACHSLVYFDKKVIGDSMEKASLQAIGWNLSENDTISGSRKILKISQKFHFTSELKRMTVVAQEGNELFVLCKGAPEKLTEFYDKSKLPKNYDEVYKHFAEKGYRVLALGYKTHPFTGTHDQIKKIPRESLESELAFAGFVVFSSPLKPDSANAIEQLRNSSHLVSMITGDNILTACQVAKDLKIVTKPALFLGTQGAQVEWQTSDATSRFPFDSDLGPLTDKFDLCLPGNFLGKFLTHKNSGIFLPHVKVFARVSPEQKELILSNMNSHGNVQTLMCGDGTNDVGALKQAHVGVALLNSNFVPGLQRPTLGALLKAAKKASAPPTPPVAGPSTPSNPAVKTTAVPAKTAVAPRVPMGNFQERTAKMLEEMDQQDQPLVQLGDASIASPFTAKGSSVMSIVHIIRQGRCTLVTTLQMYKILALNCLISAYSLSVLYLDGVKMGDTQVTIAGMLISMCFLFISRSKPLQNLSKERPQPNLFNIWMFFSILGQFAVHLVALVTVTNMAQDANAPKPDPDSDFTPNLLNSAIFLIYCSMQVSTFAINYKGHPFMQSLKENRPLLYCLSAVGLLTVFLALEIEPDFNHQFEMVPFPSDEFRNKLASVIVLDFGVAWLIDFVMSRINLIINKNIT